MSCLIIALLFNQTSTLLERIWLISFITVFPIILLIAFLFMAIVYPQNLYAPYDFSDEQLWVKALTDKEKKEKVKKEISELENDLPNNKDNKTDIRRKYVIIKQHSEIKDKINRIEDAAISKINEDFSLELKREVKLGTSRRNMMYCDGYQYKDGIHYIAEIKYIPYINGRNLDSFISQLDRMEKQICNLGINNSCELIVCIVYDQKDASFQFGNIEKRISYIKVAWKDYRTEDLLS